MYQGRGNAEIALSIVYQRARRKIPLPIWVASPAAGIEALDRWRCAHRTFRGEIALALAATALAWAAPVGIPVLALLVLLVRRADQLTRKASDWRKAIRGFEPMDNGLVLFAFFPVWIGEIAGTFSLPPSLLLYHSTKITCGYVVLVGFVPAMIFVLIVTALVAASACGLLRLFVLFLRMLLAAWDLVRGHRRLVDLVSAAAVRRKPEAFGAVSELGQEAMSFEEAVTASVQARCRFSGAGTPPPPLWLTRAMREVDADQDAASADAVGAFPLGWLYERICVLCEPPVDLFLDEQGCPHAEDGPAIRYGDGWEIYALHGVVLRSDQVLSPSIADILRPSSERAREVLLERFGWPFFLERTGAWIEQQDDYGKLWCLPAFDLTSVSQIDFHFKVVEVVNSTPEPDGSFRHHFLRVPLEIETAREAVAWTFAVDESKYEPARQA